MGYAISVVNAPGDRLEGAFYGCSSMSWSWMCEDMAAAASPKYRKVLVWLAGLYNDKTQLIWWKRARKIAEAIESLGDFERRLASDDDIADVLAVFKEAVHLKKSVELW